MEIIVCVEGTESNSQLGRLGRTAGLKAQSHSYGRPPPPHSSDATPVVTRSFKCCLLLARMGCPPRLHQRHLEAFASFRVRGWWPSAVAGLASCVTPTEPLEGIAPRLRSLYRRKGDATSWSWRVAMGCRFWRRSRRDTSIRAKRVILLDASLMRFVCFRHVSM